MSKIVKRNQARSTKQIKPEHHGASSSMANCDLFYWSSHKADKNPIPSTTYNATRWHAQKLSRKKFTTCPCSGASLERTSLVHATIVQYCAAKIVQQNSEFHIMDRMCHDSVVVDIPHSIHDTTETVDGQIPNSAFECSIVENDNDIRCRTWTNSIFQRCRQRDSLRHEMHVSTDS